MAEWRETVAAVLSAPGIVMFLGAVDVGKTTAATALAIAAVRAGRPPGSSTPTSDNRTSARRRRSGLAWWTARRGRCCRFR